mmetsp:Transcript_101590/g.185375  ORF Transcript_101590/g.185375 Transcript_101590/m.185375 type:complete len:1014 (-) Transcript_101590:193-3234(-)
MTDALLSHLRKWDPNGNGELKHEQLITVLKELDATYWSDEKIKMLLESLPDPISIEKFADSLSVQGMPSEGADTGMSNAALIKACEARGIKVLQEQATIDVALCKKLKPEEREAIRAVFNNYDKDGSGSIDLQELSQMCKELGRTVTEAQAKEAMKQLDRDGSGKCDFNEFLLYWTSKPILGGYDEITLQMMKTALATKAATAKAKTIAQQMMGKPVPDAKGFLKSNFVISPNMGPFEPKMSAKLSLSKVEAERIRPMPSLRLVANDEKGAGATADAIQEVFTWFNEDPDFSDAPFKLAVEQIGNVVECKLTINEDNEDFDDPMFAMMLDVAANCFDWVDVNLDWSNDISDLVGQPDKHPFENLGGLRMSLDSQIQHGYLKTVQMMMADDMDGMEDPGFLDLWKSFGQAFNGSGMDTKIGYFPEHLKVVARELKSIDMEIPSLAKMQAMAKEEREMTGPPDEGFKPKFSMIARVLKELSANVSNLESISLTGLGAIAAKITFTKFRPWLLAQYILQPRIDLDVEGKEDIPQPVQGFSAVRDIGDKERERIKKTFDQYDKDGSGAIDLKELEGMVKELGGSITTEEAQEAIKQLDKDGSLTINFQEFELWWSSKPGCGGYSSVALGFLRMKMNGWNAMMKAKKALVNNTFGVTEDSDTMISQTYTVAPDMTPQEPKMFMETTFKQESAASSSDEASVVFKIEASSAEAAATALGLIKEKYAEFEPMLAEMPVNISFDQEDADIVFKAFVPAEMAAAMMESADPGMQMMMANLVTAIQAMLNSSIKVSYPHTFEDFIENPEKNVAEVMKGMKMEMKFGLTAAGRVLLSGISIPGFQNVFRPLVRSFAGLQMDVFNGFNPEKLAEYMNNSIQLAGKMNGLEVGDGTCCFNTLRLMLEKAFPNEALSFIPVILDTCKLLKGPKSLTISGFLPKPGADGAKLECKTSFEKFNLFPLIAFLLEPLKAKAAEFAAEAAKLQEEMAAALDTNTDDAIVVEAVPAADTGEEAPLLEVDTAAP